MNIISKKIITKINLKTEKIIIIESNTITRDSINQNNNKDNNIGINILPIIINNNQKLKNTKSQLEEKKKVLMPIINIKINNSKIIIKTCLPSHQVK